jgi:hypothetical protein
MTNPVYEVAADRIIDFSARYNFKDSHQKPIGAVKRQGMRSLWRARYDIFDNDYDTEPTMIIQEENPWVKVCDALLSEIPLVGMFTGYFCNPSYGVVRLDGKTVMRLEKKPGFLSRHFTIKMLEQLNEQEEMQCVLSFLMMILLERQRG